MISDKQYMVIELYLNGENISNIAKKVNVTRQTIYSWLDKQEVKTEIDKRLTEIKSQAGKKLNSKVNLYLEELEKIALTSDSDKVRADVLSYLVDRTLGKTTTKLETNTKEQDDNAVNLEDDLKELDNIIKLPNAK